MAHSLLPLTPSSAPEANTPSPAILAAPKNIRILLAGDATGEAAQALRAVFSPPEHALELTAVSSVETLIPTLGVVSPEIILLDLAATQPHHKEMVRRVHRAAPQVPLILFGDRAQEEVAREALAEGAMDYFLRDNMDGATLSRVFRGAFERNTVEGLADLLRDSLTGLYTRDGLLTLGSNTMDVTRRKGGTLALFCVFLNNLHEARESLGDAAVAQVLKELAKALTECFRRSDFVARLGEAQFAVLAVDPTEQGVTIVRQRLDRQLAKLRRESGVASLRLTVNGCRWTATENISFAELLDVVEAGLREPAKGTEVSV
jgi:diguanylate cyclase (GGDEF)-like protein